MNSISCISRCFSWALPLDDQESWDLFSFFVNEKNITNSLRRLTCRLSPRNRRGDPKTPLLLTLVAKFKGLTHLTISTSGVQGGINVITSGCSALESLTWRQDAGQTVGEVLCGYDYYELKSETLKHFACIGKGFFYLAAYHTPVLETLDIDTWFGLRSLRYGGTTKSLEDVAADIKATTCPRLLKVCLKDKFHYFSTQVWTPDM